MQDSGPNHGGLGVVSRSANGTITGSDEINLGDTLTLSCADRVKIVGFHFWDQAHGSGDLNSGDLFGLSIDGGATKQLSLTNFPWCGGSSLLVGNGFTFSYVNEDHYLGAIKVAAAAPVPEPETYALMWAGLGASAFVARRRRTAV